MVTWLSVVVSKSSNVSSNSTLLSFKTEIAMVLGSVSEDWKVIELDTTE